MPSPIMGTAMLIVEVVTTEAASIGTMVGIAAIIDELTAISNGIIANSNASIGNSIAAGIVGTTGTIDCLLRA